MSRSSKDFVYRLQELFTSNGDAEAAQEMATYMKGKFEFYGVAATTRRELSKNLYAESGIPSDAFSIARELWTKPQRELHYVAQELLMKSKKQWKVEHIEDIEVLLTTQSWWDTIDFLASNVVGEYFRKWPEYREEVVLRWNSSENMWLVRTSILFQIKYKDQVDTNLLSRCILPHIQDKEFFIKKAIGWALRQYSKYNAEWVHAFLQTHELQPLSVKEATKYLK